MNLKGVVPPRRPSPIGSTGSTGPVRPIGDQLLQTMGEIYQQVEFRGDGGAVGRAVIFGAELNGRMF